MTERLNGGIYDQILKLEEVVMRSCNHVINIVISATADDNQHAFIRCFFHMVQWVIHAYGCLSNCVISAVAGTVSFLLIKFLFRMMSPSITFNLMDRFSKHLT